MTVNNQLSLDQLRRLVLPQPKKPGYHWQSLPHIDLVEAVTKEAKLRHWNLGQFKCFVTTDKGDMYCQWNLEFTRGEHPKDANWILGIYNSVLCRTRLKIGCGISSLQGAIVPIRQYWFPKHTYNFNLEEQINRTFETIEEDRLDLKNVVKVLRLIALEDMEAEAIMVRACKAKCFPGSRLVSFDKFFKEEKFLWNLVLAFSSLNAYNPPLRQFALGTKFYQLIEQMNQPKDDDELM